MSQRRLAAIMFTDIVGYSALSQRNESAALALVQTQQDLLRPLIASHNGEEIKSTGDGLLLEFASALQSVECAVQMQQAVRARNRDNARAVPLELRIGIHLGDVEHRDGDVFGDGVNIAARIEPLAAPGSIYISEDVARQVDGKLNVALHSHGPQALKNIRRPVEVFEVIADTSGAPTSSGSGETPNSIAVLPFADMSAAGDNEYFADGMTEELIDTFARIPDLKVIARTSVFALKGKDLDIRQIGDKLGVETVLEGSVRRAGDRLRITAQLIKVSDQSHLWSQRYDRDMGDVFAIQEDIARAIADALTARFGASAAQSLSVAVCCDPEAYSLFLQGRYFTNQRTQESLEKAKACFQQALEISPDYAGAEAGLALAALWQGSYYGDLEKNMTIASIAARRAVELDPNLAEAHSAMGEFLLLREFDWGGAEAEFRRALAINSADTEAQEGLSTVLAVSERTDEAIAQIEEFLSSNPLSLVIRRRLGVAHYVARDYASAEAVFRQLLEISPELALTQSWLGQVLLAMGRPEEALAAYQREIDPMFRAHGLAKAYFILGRSKEADEQLAELIRIGVPGAYYQIAQVQAVRGEREAAMTALENAWEVRDPGISYLRVDQFFDSLRDQPRVKAILEHIGAARD